jgi:tungstate transport system substrate-binding protein
MKSLIRTTWLLAFTCLLGCSDNVDKPAREITLATTTSTQDSGLLKVLLPAFEKDSGIHVKVVAVGSGQALELGRRGDADVLLTHSPAAEQKFMEAGLGATRLPVMHNDFVIVGPPGDPAGVKDKQTAAAALQAISIGKYPFVSRADESGTHVKERALWKSAQIEPSGDWYIKAGTGMGQAMLLADEKQGYILADRATFLALRNRLQNQIVLEGDPELLNHYSVIPISPDKHKHLHSAEAEAFAKFLMSPAGQELIRTFGIEQFGQPLFVPNAIKR